MVFVIQKKGRIEEELHLVDENGNIEHVIMVSVDIDDFLPRYYKARKNLESVQESIKNCTDDEERLSQVGNAVIALFDVVFGSENTEKIVSFYNGRYTKMLVEISPFLSEVIYPKIKQASNQKMAEIKQLHKTIK